MCQQILVTKQISLSHSDQNSRAYVLDFSVLCDLNYIGLCNPSIWDFTTIATNIHAKMELHFDRSWQNNLTRIIHTIWSRYINQKLNKGRLVSDLVESHHRLQLFKSSHRHRVRQHWDKSFSKVSTNALNWRQLSIQREPPKETQERHVLHTSCNSDKSDVKQWYISKTLFFSRPFFPRNKFKEPSTHLFKK